MEVQIEGKRREEGIEENMLRKDERELKRLRRKKRKKN